MHRLWTTLWMTRPGRTLEGTPVDSHTTPDHTPDRTDYRETWERLTNHVTPQHAKWLASCTLISVHGGLAMSAKTGDGVKELKVHLLSCIAVYR